MPAARCCGRCPRSGPSPRCSTSTRASTRACWSTPTRSICTGSAWIGALHDPLPGGAPVDLFKSWAQRRRAEPKNIILERRFQHPLIDPHAIAAARALRAHQGHGGLWFSGAYTTGSDLQETALYSAMQVAERLAPSSENLTALQARARAKGLAQVSYDL